MTTARRAGIASAATLSGLALALCFAHAAAPDWVRRAGLDVWNAASLRRDFRHTRDEGAALRRVHDRLNLEIEATDQVVARLIDGGMALAEAVDELSPVLAARPGFVADGRRLFGTETLRRTVAAYLIAKAGRAIADADPSRWVIVSDRLRAEFAAIE